MHVGLTGFNGGKAAVEGFVHQLVGQIAASGIFLLFIVPISALMRALG
ncbi:MULTISPECIES: hypothetical protein [Mesorhizobium]|uniref:Uncharacterized protein n=1 Tax=Mesorhizobium opportunistum (strain LMG 24607 / HAMBI 3007 / WSM2075) TaxID=536019 RepID=F7Y9V8_MESOW|nr:MULTISPECIES: hypothetical protein [Mesorhizobium]AEH89897.1 hypothetical protein Mesop_5481 [Mesorhizobium opportunistum WSM2075]